jgi:hypothetical protein
MTLDTTRTLFQDLSSQLTFENVWIEIDGSGEPFTGSRTFDEEDDDGYAPGTGDTNCSINIPTFISFTEGSAIGSAPAPTGDLLTIFASETAGGNSATITCTNTNVSDEVVAQITVPVVAGCVDDFSIGIDLVYDGDDNEDLDDQDALVNNTDSTTEVTEFEYHYPGLFPGVPFAIRQVHCVNNLDADASCTIEYSVTEGADLVTFDVDTGLGMVSETAEAGGTVEITAIVSEDYGACPTLTERTFTFDVLPLDLDNIMVALSDGTGNDDVSEDDDGQFNVTLPYEVDEPIQATGVYVYWYDSLPHYYYIDLTRVASYESLNTGVADFQTDSNVLSTLEYGRTTVRASYMGVTSFSDLPNEPYELDVKVSDKVVEYVEISVRQTVVGVEDEVRVPIGEFTVQLVATAYYSDGTYDDVTITTDTPDEFEWTIESPESAGAGTVSSEGLFTSGSVAGDHEVMFTYTYGTYGETVTDTIIVTVDPGALASLNLIDADHEGTTTSIIRGRTNDYDAVGTLAGSTTQYYMSDRDLAYSSSNSTQGGTIDDDGVLDTLLLCDGVPCDPTTTQIIVSHATSGVNSSGLWVEIIDAVAEGIVCRPGWVQRTPDDTVQFLVEILYSNGDSPAIVANTTEWTNLSFDSGNPVVADILDGSPKSTVTALEIGVATITATWYDTVSDMTFADTCDVEVVEELSIPGTCGERMEIDADDQIIYGSTENAGNDNDGYGDDGGEDVFYMFDLMEPATLDLSVLFPSETGWTINPIVSEGCNGSSEVETVDSGSGELICLASGTYYLIVDGELSTDWGAFELDLDFEYGCVPEFTGDGDVDIPDTCTTAHPLDSSITLQEDIPGTTTGAVSDVLDPGEDVFYTFTLDATSNVDISLDTGVSGMRAVVRTEAAACEEDLVTGTGGDIDYGTSGCESLSAGTYYLVIDSTGASGDFEMTIDFDATSCS